MQLHRLRPVLVPILALLFACASNRRSAEGETGSSASIRQALTDPDFEWSTTLSSGTSVEVHGVQGTITVDAASDGTLRVEGRKSGRGNLDLVEVQIVEAGDRIVVCTVYPGGRCDADGYQGRGRDSIDVQVDLTIQLPPGTGLTAKTVNGSIVARGVTGRLAADTVNGNVDLRTEGEAAAKTVNGSIVAEVPLRLGRDLSLRTVNGAVRVELPAAVDAEVSAATVNGRIESDFPLSHRGRVAGGEASGRLGQGGPQLEVHTVNGSIRIRRTDPA